MYSFKPLFIILFLLSSCLVPDKQKQAQKPFFSLADFFEEEAKTLAAQNLHIKRTVRIEDNVSQSTDSLPNWKNEFYLLKELDINKAALADDYKTDSVVQKNQRHIFYENISGTQKVRYIHLFWSADNKFPDLIEITTKEKSLFKEEELIYSYQRGKAYGVIGVRKSFFSSAKEIDILCVIEE